MANEIVPRCLTPKQLAVLYPTYTPQYWRMLLASGRIPGASKPFGKWLVPVEAVEQLLESGRVDAA